MFKFSDKSIELQEQLKSFMDKYIYPVNNMRMKLIREIYGNHQKL